MKLNHKRILLDGGLGRELRFRGVALPKTIWSAGALMTDPGVVRQIHLDYIAAGADIITTNTYGVIRKELAKEGLVDRFAELNKLACNLALEAREASGREVVIAGSLPPLGGSYRPDLVGPPQEIEALYQEQAELLAPHVDLLLCETMSSATEGHAAAKAACRTGKPVWVAWTLHENRSGNLRSGENVTKAVAALQELPVSGFLANCCAPESITKVMPQLAETGAQWIGGYANTFTPVPEDWTLEGEKDTDGLLTLRPDLGPEEYSAHVSEWLAAGATVVGGCCGTRPSHTAKMRALLDGKLP
ncbi:5-methyltetrahydrofolate--homocysteine methyltransferase (EC [Olavius algarvensis associated proteobacterium Delta 3]|nr:5-methyltetrahydrofolate--homocysteine methyltransferase (EC [Olavius algarvensis associated proteobacterium Delta 3]CAB5119093.1 5-methyltetrahydrofolate--homocysteine methyltransferase (EC [Olavius algarvensis associated proteobacterium Delta 3]